MSLVQSRFTHNTDFRPDKLDQVILFFLTHASIEHLGDVKLMTLLYYADFNHFEQFGQSITGAVYRKFEDGPVPNEAPDAMLRLIDEPRAPGQIQPLGASVAHRLASRLKPDPSFFSVDEMQTLNEVVSHWKQHTPREIVAAARREAPWLAVQLNQEIPYYLAGYRNNFGGMDLDADELAAMSEDHADTGG